MHSRFRAGAADEFRLYSERVIHGEIYKARPDVHAVVHHHAHAVLPYAISGREMVPVFHLGAVIGHVPFWDQRDEFGDTNMLVVKPEEGASLARALGPNWTVLMRRHGATVAGTSLRQLTFRTVFGCHNAKLQSQAMAHGHVDHYRRASRRSPGRTNCGRSDAPRLGLLGAPHREGRADARDCRREAQDCAGEDHGKAQGSEETWRAKAPVDRRLGSHTPDGRNLPILVQAPRLPCRLDLAEVLLDIFDKELTAKLEMAVVAVPFQSVDFSGAGDSAR